MGKLNLKRPDLDKRKEKREQLKEKQLRNEEWREEESEREEDKIEVEIPLPDPLGVCVFCGDSIPLHSGGYVRQTCERCRMKFLKELEESGELEEYIRDSGLLDDICSECDQRIPEEPMRNEGYL